MDEVFQHVIKCMIADKIKNLIARYFGVHDSAETFVINNMKIVEQLHMFLMEKHNSSHNIKKHIAGIFNDTTICNVIFTAFINYCAIDQLCIDEINYTLNSENRLKSFKNMPLVISKFGKYYIPSYTEEKICTWFPIKYISDHAFNDLICLYCRNVPNNDIAIRVGCNTNEKIIHCYCLACLKEYFGTFNNQYNCSYCMQKFKIDDMIVYRRQL